MEKFKLLFVNLNRHSRLLLFILFLILFVIGAGAPGAGGDIGMRFLR